MADLDPEEHGATPDHSPHASSESENDVSEDAREHYVDLE